MPIVKGFAIRNGSRTNGHGDAMPPGILISTSVQANEPPEPAQLRLVEKIIEHSKVPPHEVETTTRDILSRPRQERNRSCQVTGDAVEGEQSRDRQAADELVKLVQQLNRAMEESKRGGLIVEPSLSTTKSQFGGEGSGGHMPSIKVFRKLC